MKILHYSRYFPFPVAYELALRQMSIGHEVLVACWPGMSKLPRGVTLYNGVKVNCFGINIYSNPVKFKLVPFKLLRMFNDVVSLSNMLKSFDVVHIHGPTFFIYPQLYSIGICEWGISKRLTGIPAIWTYQGLRKLLSKYWNAIVNEMKHADMCTAANKQTADLLKVIYVPNGVNTNKFKPLSPRPDRTKFGLPDDRIVLLHVARWIPIKGHDRLVRCLSKLDHETLKKIFVLFVGPIDRGYLAYYTKVITDLKKVGVSFITLELPYEQIHIAYNLADIFCLTSREGYPLVLLEAMASGLPVIILKADSSPDMKSVLIANNYDEFSEKLYYLIYNEDIREKIGGEARKEALQYDWEKINQLYLNLYSKL
jgi:glycosyltransferase involved in cell wall biosynthesis